MYNCKLALYSKHLVAQRYIPFFLFCHKHFKKITAIYVYSYMYIDNMKGFYSDIFLSFNWSPYHSSESDLKQQNNNNNNYEKYHIWARNLHMAISAYTSTVTSPYCWNKFRASIQLLRIK